LKRTHTIAGVATALLLAACGSDGDGGDGESGLDGPQADAARAAVESAAADGIELDQACVDEIASQLSDEDAALAAADGDAELSPEGEALSIQLIDCADDGQLVDFFITNLTDGGVPFDEDCAREQLQQLDLKALIATTADGGDPPPAFVEALTPCFEP